MSEQVSTDSERLLRCLMVLLGGYQLSDSDRRFMLAYHERLDDERKEREAVAFDDAKRGFQWRDGWFFNRVDDGSVRVSQVDWARKHVTLQVTIPAPEWASIVCSVSRDGETAERWNRAQDFHGR